MDPLLPSSSSAATIRMDSNYFSNRDPSVIPSVNPVSEHVVKRNYRNSVSAPLAEDDRATIHSHSRSSATAPLDDEHLHINTAQRVDSYEPSTPAGGSSPGAGQGTTKKSSAAWSEHEVKLGHPYTIPIDKSSAHSLACSEESRSCGPLWTEHIVKRNSLVVPIEDDGDEEGYFRATPQENRRQSIFARDQHIDLAASTAAAAAAVSEAKRSESRSPLPSQYSEKDLLAFQYSLERSDHIVKQRK